MPYTYDPARVHPSELPIARRARAKNFDLWTARSARTLCDLLRHEPDPDMYGFTPEEWESIAAVARGEIWPIPERPYTGDDWTRDGSFAAAYTIFKSHEIELDIFPGEEQEAVTDEDIARIVAFLTDIEFAPVEK